MDFVKGCTTDEAWVASHEQYRPFVLFHRTQAAALGELDTNNPDAAVEEIGLGLNRMRELYEAHDVDEEFEDDEMVGQLIELREWLREQYEIGPTLVEQLADAVAAEDYELAARLRDEIARRSAKRP
jgi:hypothetical protein